MTEYKLVVIGDGGVGKSALVIQMVQSHFIEEYDPTIEDSYRKQIVVDDETCLIDVLDTAGPEEYSAMRDQYCRTAQGFIAVYSITSRTSFREMQGYLEYALVAKSLFKVPLIVVGNKTDLDAERQISTEEGQAFAKLYGGKFIETSAKLRLNVDEVFHEIVREVRLSISNPQWWQYSVCKHLLLGDKEAMTYEVASKVSGFKLPSSAYDAVTNKWGYPCFPAVPLSFSTLNATHMFWGINNAWNYDKDMVYYKPSMKNADIVYISFSLINRPSFESVTKYKVVVDKHFKNAVKVLLGTQSDVREWFSIEKPKKNQVENKDEKIESSGVDLFSLVPDDIALQILGYLPVLGPIACTCSRLDKLSKHPSVWGVRKIMGPLITYEEGKKMAKELGCIEYLEVGANTGKGLETNIFDTLYESHIKEPRENKISQFKFNQPKDKMKKKKKKRFFFF